MGVFGEHATAYINAGMPVFPVDPVGKKPLVRGWNKCRLSTSRQYVDKFCSSDGIGLCAGRHSGIVEVDIDQEGPSALYYALERFGETPLVIGTASGKYKAWYRHGGEGRHIRVTEEVPIDLLGAGMTIAPPSFQRNLEKSYVFLQGSLEDLQHLPRIRRDALEHLAPASSTCGFPPGQRNSKLFRWCMIEARSKETIEQLIDAAEALNRSTADPLPSSEVKKTARSAWRYEDKGRNFLGVKRPSISGEDRVLDALIDYPDAFALLAILRRWHSNRESFRIAPTAMSKAKHPPWCRKRIEKARDVLVDRRLLRVVSPPRQGSRNAGVYALALSELTNNHYTPFPFPRG